MGLCPINIIIVIETGAWGYGSFREGFLEEGTSKRGPEGGVGRSLSAEAKYN